MATSISNGESGLSVRTKLNDIWHSLDLNEYNKEILDTAVDVFVYDTSKDSDGGAWRKRTQHTSWYNETLNTATRGSRKEFPAVAVIVAESNQVTIYDGDDPDLPMWMVFNANGSTLGTFWYSTRNTDSVTAHNGLVAFGSNGDTWGGLRSSNFLADKLYRRSNTGLYGGVAVTERNVTAALPTISTAASYHLVNATVNDVAMTVLPNAPIDAATGLPVPTIAVATDGGVSVIKDDGTVVDITFSTHNVSSQVDFVEGDKILFATDQDARGRFIKVYEIPSADLSEGYGYDDNTALESYQIRADGLGADLTFATPSASLYDIANRNFATDKGLASVAPDIATPSSGLSSVITSDYNTGWMNGDIKLATLSDTNDTDLVAATPLDDDFSTYVDTAAMKAAGWISTASTGTGDISLVSGAMQLDCDGTVNRARGYQTITTVIGATYVVGYSSTLNHHFRVGTTVNGSQNLSLLNQPTGANTFTYTFVATATTTYVTWEGFNLAGQEPQIDNVSVRLAEEDRSVNGNGLQVFGTVTKNPVATGADLVGYSGFSSSNYLEQPYNSGLDFGTGDFCVMGWVKRTATSGNILDRGNGSNNTDRIQIHVFSGSEFRVVLDGTALATSTIPSGVWTHLTYVRRSGVGYLYLNSNLETSGAQAGDVSNTYATKIGISQTLGDPLPGDLALLRISGTAPTAEQIAKIYEDEKVLFQENAQATLYGTSDAVTALAYDDTTELLHVGTSDGRSVFQGLRRVDNTTDAITAAISASNNLVAEE